MDLSPIGIPTTSQTFALRVEGDAMVSAGINDGDVVILEKRPPRPGDVVAALIETAMTLKRYVSEHGTQLLRADPHVSRDMQITDESLVQGVAVGLIRRL